MAEERRQGCGLRGISRSKAREVLGIFTIAFSLFLLVSLLSYDPLDPSFFSSGRGKVSNYAGRLGAELSGDLFELLGLSALALPPFLFLLGFRWIGGRSLEPLPVRLVGLFLLLPSFSLFAALLQEEGVLASAALDRPGGFLGDEFRRTLLPLLGPVGLYLFALTGLAVSSVLFSRRPLLAWPLFLSKRWDRLVKRFQTGRTKPTPAKFVETFNVQRSTLQTSTAVAEVVAKDAEPEAAVAIPVPEERPQRPSIQSPGADFTTHGWPRSGRFPAGHRFPPIALLDPPSSEVVGVTEEELQQNAEILERKLRDFGVEGKVAEIQPGPVITRYEIEPAPGIKINRIVALADDLALALKAMTVRVVAPIPGKAVVGVEIPNRNRAVVSLREILSSREYEQKKATTPLPLALGKDIAGEPYVADLLQMPHLLIAGATGSGKSICLHALILSILYRSTPEEVRFLLIDPKRVELSIYNGLPHLADAVIYDAKEAAKKLHRVVVHMEERYRVFAETGARNLVAYNRLSKPEEPRRPLPSAIGPRFDHPQVKASPPIPHLLVVIDELADLMHLAAAEVENAIARLAQMARAVGIHLMVATQRPSVDVITGVIKANFPARLSFQVSSKVDSRTILDQNGAEQLLGSGDMLFVPPQSSKPIRIHAPYVSEPEIQKVVEYLRLQGEAEPFQWSLLPEEMKGAYEEEPDDQLYRQAVEIVLQTRQASISLLQRRLRIGFNRAARLIERMEAEGIVSPMEGGRPREVLVSDDG